MVAKIPEVRAALLEYQRTFASQERGAVLDGRDIGTVVCPDANVKIFVTASDEVRARRRHIEHQARGENLTYEELLADIRRRDARDSSRSIAPLAAAPDATSTRHDQSRRRSGVCGSGEDDRGESPITP